ncbi:hypothetical protein DRB96_30995 [Streptomyces sp. ICC1]|nr:hypothetical protein DRB89_37810 [Streptomyces sp. ICC4]AWZ18355.1 hypothetical protein DRB96_30995 [Streptomyces sp. ICC1]
MHVRWVMPEGFFELPFEAEDIDDLAEKLVELGQAVLPHADYEIQVHWAAMMAAGYDDFAEAGVQYAGFVMTEVEEARCTSTVTVSLMELDAGGASTGDSTVPELARALRALDNGTVEEISLPCGPAVSVVGTRKAMVDGALTESGAPEPVFTSFLQVQVPLTNGLVVVLEMGTPTPEGWDVFSSMFAGVVKSLRFFDSDSTLLVMP